MSAAALVETIIQPGAEEQFLDLSSFVFPKMYDEQEMFDPFPGFDSSASAPDPVVAASETPHSGSSIKLFADRHPSRPGTPIRQYTCLELTIEEDDDSEEDTFGEDEKEGSYDDDMDWKMDNDMNVTDVNLQNQLHCPPHYIPTPTTSPHLYASTSFSAIPELLISRLEEQHSARYPRLGQTQNNVPAKRPKANKKESSAWVRRSTRVRSRNAGELQHPHCTVLDSPPGSNSTAASSTESDCTVSPSPEPPRSRHFASKASNSSRCCLASSSCKSQLVQPERQEERAARKRGKCRQASEKRNLQNKNAQKKYRDKKKNLAIRTFDFAVELTRLGRTIEGRMAKVFRDTLNEYLEEIGAMDDNYLRKFMDRAGMDCR
ncbi:hypothetical protein I307_01680 [Cryptococcus deuterogattii 99/473]|uniref:BZIP domain-containing protein n=1 Tax=Cryptococcus deuterogattii Ram5 TaxID=1296110 RepID=A0A0D0T060_9TREE|nr:hypothetical protein I313_05114 [Cryptococcus deuterogattii Ram5]KIY58880.1 hypothetical protein I307_01680 [Cryptococcus deuterogattii 99/473]